MLRVLDVILERIVGDGNSAWNSRSLYLSYRTTRVATTLTPTFCNLSCPRFQLESLAASNCHYARLCSQVIGHFKVDGPYSLLWHLHQIQLRSTFVNTEVSARSPLHLWEDDWIPHAEGQVFSFVASSLHSQHHFVV